MMPQLVYSFMGTSRHLSVGPVAMDSLLVASGLGALNIAGISNYIAMAIVLTFFVGTLQLTLGILKMGFLVNFLSTPVISGFTSAAALIIGLNQLSNFLGANIEQASKLHELTGNIFSRLGQTHLYTLLMGSGAVLLILVFQKIKKNPASLIVVMLSIIVVYLFKLDSQGVAIVAAIPKGLPTFEIPQITLTNLQKLFPVAITLALVAFMESMSVVKAMANKHQYEISPNQELLALGTSNIIGAFFASYPATGSFTRTALNDLNGSKTGLTGLISALIIGSTLLFFTPLFYYLPDTVLAAVILVAVGGLFDMRYPIRLYNTKKDEFYLLLITFLLTLFVGIIQGILFGSLLALLLLVHRTAKPHIAELGKIKGTSYFKNKQRFIQEVEQNTDVIVIRFDDQLYFGNKDYFKSEVLNIIAAQSQQPKSLILKAEPISYIDSSALMMLEQLVESLQQKGIQVLISELIGPTRDIIMKSNIFNLIGKTHFFVDTADAYQFATVQKEKNALQEKIALQIKDKS
jgi:SulP family sulfate permease